MAALSDYLENKLIDYVLRATTYTPPTTLYVGLFTANPTDTGGGTEVSGGSYARASIASSLANWAGTQGAGTTVASTGTSGTTSNNVAISFPSSTAAWGTVTGVGVFDASTSGNLLIWGALSQSQVIPNGLSSISFAPAAFSFQIDN